VEEDRAYPVYAVPFGDDTQVHSRWSIDSFFAFTIIIYIRSFLITGRARERERERRRRNDVRMFARISMSPQFRSPLLLKEPFSLSRNGAQVKRARETVLRANERSRLASPIVDINPLSRRVNHMTSGHFWVGGETV